MTSVLIKELKGIAPGSLFVVSHREEPAWCQEEKIPVLVIPDTWGNDSVRCAWLASESTTRVLNLDGSGVVVEELPALDDGDVVYIDAASHRLQVLFQINSTTNALYVTNACNSRCQFCPQPSSVDNGVYYDLASRTIDIVKRPGECVNITGGEPTIRRDKLLSLLGNFEKKWTSTKSFILTNGRLFSDFSLAEAVSQSRASRENIGFGIPLYSDAACQHDSVVGVEGAFGQTVRGLYNLATQRVEIEIRFVVSQLSYQRLPQLMQYIGRNLPFVSRIAIMGLEPMGYCRAHWDKFWIDPEDARPQLVKAFEIADNYGLTALLYNFQLCCLPRELWKYAVSSISEWKRVYIPKCLQCPYKSDCGGFFASQNADQYRPRIMAK